MKPFNLQEALAGKKVVTRTGTAPITGLHLFEDVTLGARLFGVSSATHKVHQWNEDGTYAEAGVGRACDLFMATEKKSGWIAVWTNSPKLVAHSTHVHATKVEAMQEAMRFTVEPAVAVYIEWEV